MTEIKKVFSIEGIRTPQDLIDELDKFTKSTKIKVEELLNDKQYEKVAEEYLKISNANKLVFEAIREDRIPNAKKDLNYMQSILKENITFWENYSDNIRKSKEPSKNVTEIGRKANKLRDEGNYEQSLELFDEAIRMAESGDLAWLYNDKGNVYFDLFKFEQAIEHYDKALSYDPNFPHSLLNKSMALEKLLKFNEAKEYYLKTLETSPDNVIALTNLGVLNDRSGNTTEAKKYFDRAYQIEPTNPLYILNKAIGLFATGDYEGSIEYYKKSIKLDKNSIIGNLGLAEAYFLTKKYDDAKKILKELEDKTINPTFGFVARLLRNCVEHRFNSDKANELSRDVLRFMQEPLDTTLYNLDDVKKFVKKSGEFSQNAEKVILLIIEAYENEKVRKTAIEKLEDIISNNNTHSFFKKIVSKSGNKNKLKFKIVNTSYPDTINLGYYNWEIYVDEPSERLDQISHVRYYLHPTFGEPPVDRHNSVEKFSLSRRGWGEFLIKIKIFLKSDPNLPITQYHHLDLTPTDRRGETLFESKMSKKSD